MELIEENNRFEQLKKLGKAKQPIKVMLHDTSIHDLLLAMDRCAEYDRMLAHLGITSFDNWANEDKVLKKLGKPFIQEFVELNEINA